MIINGVSHFDSLDSIIRPWYIPVWWVATKCKKCKLYPCEIGVQSHLCGNCEPKPNRT